jgi:hypothetical protein
MTIDSQRAAFEAFVRSGKSPTPPSEIVRPLADGTYRTSAANAAWLFWQAGCSNGIEQAANGTIITAAQQLYDSLGNEIFAAAIEKLKQDPANSVEVVDSRQITCSFVDGSQIIFADGFAHVNARAK